MFKLLSSVHSALYRVTRGKLMGRVEKLNVLLLTTTGRKKGKARTVPLLYTETGSGHAVVASKGGAENDPAWCVNLRASPAAQVELGGKRFPVKARETAGEERETLWREFAAGYHGYEGYRQKTTRPIPIFVLEPTRD